MRLAFDSDKIPDIPFENLATGTFRNDECGVFQTNAEIINRSIFLNQGFIEGTEYGRPSLNNLDIFTNAGVIDGEANFLSQISSNVGYVTKTHLGLTFGAVGDIFATIFHGPGANISLQDQNLRIGPESNDPIGATYDVGTLEWTLGCECSGAF